MKWSITEGLQTDLGSSALPANMVQYRDSQDNMVMGYSLLLYSHYLWLAERVTRCGYSNMERIVFFPRWRRGGSATVRNVSWAGDVDKDYDKSTGNVEQPVNLKKKFTNITQVRKILGTFVINFHYSFTAKWNWPKQRLSLKAIAHLKFHDLNRVLCSFPFFV